jgi:hypothetical protein
MISLQGRDTVAERLTNLGYVTGVYRGWSGSGTTVEILLMQYLDDASADACVSYLLELRGTTRNPVDGIDNGGWTMDGDGRGMQVFFRRGGIAVRMVITTMTELDVDKFQYLPAEQYAKLPAA